MGGGKEMLRDGEAGRMQQLEHLIRDRKVVFVTTKNIDYIRNVQEIRFLEKYAGKLKLIYSGSSIYAVRILKVWWKLLVLGRQYDVIFFGFSPQLAAPFMLKYHDKQIIIDFFISVYDTLVNDRKKFSARSPLAGICHWIDAYVLRRADIIVTDTKEDAKYFIDEFNAQKDKFRTVYLEADKTIYYPRVQSKRSDLEDKYIVLYFGSILPLQGADVVLRAIEILREQKNIFFQIIGPITKRYEIPESDNAEYIDWLSQQELAEYIAAADLCLAGHFSGEIDKARRTIPGKAYIYNAMGKKMVLGDNQANRELYNAVDTVYWTAMGDPDALAEVIVQCSHMQ